VLTWFAIFIAFGVLLTVGVERLLARLGVRRAEPTPRPFADLVGRLERWATARRRPS
jgi:hypothetical protein